MPTAFSICIRKYFRIIKIRLALLSQYSKAIIIIGLLFCLIIIAALVLEFFLRPTLGWPSYTSSPIIYLLLLLAAYLMINILLLLGYKMAIRFAFLVHGIIILTTLFFCLLLEGADHVLLFFLLPHIPFYYELFKIRKSWETAVSHD